MKTETPKTDAIADRWPKPGQRHGEWPEIVPADFARELERELNTEKGIHAYAKTLLAKKDAENASLREALTGIRRWVGDGDCSDDSEIWPGYASTAYKDAVRMVDDILSNDQALAQPGRNQAPTP